MTYKKKMRIYLADLEYFNHYSSTMMSIPLNIGYIASYTLKLHAGDVEISLFKDPEKLLEASKTNPPDVLGLSCYYWNVHIDALIANRVKRINPECIVVLGGPHIDTDIEEQLDLYSSFKGYLDFMVLNEGELGFANIIGKLLSHSKDTLFDGPIDGCTFFTKDNKPVSGKDIGLSIDLETLPSPLLMGILDNYLVQEFLPMIQTSRMCPYSCAYCCSGKLIGKIRKFSDDVVKAEIEYIAKKYRNNPHRLLRLTDENFGLNQRDLKIAEFLVEAKNRFGYPQQINTYFDKHLSPTVKESALLLGDMNRGGLQLASQSFNKDSLKAVKRRNISDEEMRAAVVWAHSHGLKTESELIFGLPYETKKSFLDSLEFIMKIKIDTIAAHNLFLLKGIELNRSGERKRFNLSTKFRPSFASAYGMIDNEFVCETEEVVTSSSHFSFDDFMDIRKISLMFYLVNALEYFKKVIIYLIENEQEVIPLLDSIMNPSQEQNNNKEYLSFVNNFVNDANSELFNTHEDVSAYLKNKFISNNNSVTAPARLNAYYASRIIYNEKWFPQVLSQLLKKMNLDNQNSTVLRDLIAISENEWIDIEHPERGKAVIVSEETLAYLNIQSPKSNTGKYSLKMSASAPQREKIENYKKYNANTDNSYYYNLVYIIQPRKQLRYEHIEVEPFIE
ncbi:cobalamin-dependent protein [Patescibacteria group bacterium]|nr:cobalamin-dependent protein [Patescibacteria group bacterium]